MCARTGALYSDHRIDSIYESKANPCVKNSRIHCHRHKFNSKAFRHQSGIINLALSVRRESRSHCSTMNNREISFSTAGAKTKAVEFSEHRALSETNYKVWQSRLFVLLLAAQLVIYRDTPGRNFVVHRSRSRNSSAASFEPYFFCIIDSTTTYASLRVESLSEPCFRYTLRAYTQSDPSCETSQLEFLVWIRNDTPVGLYPLMRLVVPRSRDYVRQFRTSYRAAVKLYQIKIFRLL